MRCINSNVFFVFSKKSSHKLINTPYAAEEAMKLSHIVLSFNRLFELVLKFYQTQLQLFLSNKTAIKIPTCPSHSTPSNTGWNSLTLSCFSSSILHHCCLL